MEPSAAALDSTPDPAIVQPPGSSPSLPPREQQQQQQQQQEQLRIGESGQFSEGLEDRAVSVMRYSASSFGFAFDATLDVLSSAIVLWRYSNAAAVHSAHREYIACVILGVIFLLSSICIVIKAIHDLAKKVLPEVVSSCLQFQSHVRVARMKQDDFLYSVSVLSGILCTVLAVIKFMLGKVLTSRALITDGFNSLVGGIMGFSILLSAEVFKHNSSVWFLDGSIGVLIGLTIFAYGIKLLIDMVPRVRQTRHYEMFE
ncbi:transmembrane protein 163 isoform X3 [Anser cygnoides]|uniref:transmembrane protein 163 isoform X3 n=1 Tax=Anser cygnoides TaxID=8845 RepID=UPI0034D2E426